MELGDAGWNAGKNGGGGRSGEGAVRTCGSLASISTQASLTLPCVKTEQMKRTFDYASFIRQYILCLKDEGLLNPLLGRDQDGQLMLKDGKPGNKGKGKKV